MQEERKRGTWLMSYADLFTLLLTAFLLSVVLINELENTLFMTVDYLLGEGTRYLDGAQREQHIDTNENGKIDEGEIFIDCNKTGTICSDSPEWKENMGNGKFDPISLDGKIDNDSFRLNMDVNTPIELKKGTKGIQLTIPGDTFFKSGLAEIEERGKAELCLVGKIVFDVIKLNYINVPSIEDTITTYYTMDSLRTSLAKNCQKVTEKIRIEGHTDNKPISKSLATKWYNQTNYRLSAARALSVVEFWLSNSCDVYQMPTELQLEWFTTVGIGEHSPIAENNTPEGMAKNRRVEIFVDVDIEIDSTIIVNHLDEMITCQEYISIKQKQKQKEFLEKEEGIISKFFKSKEE